MTPLSDNDSPERAQTAAYHFDLSPVPSAAVIESWFAIESGGRDRPIDVLLALYREGALSPQHRRRVEDRLNADPKFRARLAKIDRTRDDEEVDGDGPLGARGRRETFRALVELHEEGIDLPAANRVSRRDGIALRYVRRLSRAIPSTRATS